MGDATPPRQISLVRSDFPAGKCWDDLVEALNQFSVQTVQAFKTVNTAYRTLALDTGPTPADLFPLDLKSPGFQPSEVRVAKQAGDPFSGAVTVAWHLLGTGDVRIDGITGLAANSSYSIRLGID